MNHKIENQKSFAWFAILMGLCCIAHLSVHLPQASFSASWIAGVTVMFVAAWLVYRPTLSTFLGLAIAQLTMLVIDASFNADHWVLIGFVNMIAVGAAAKLYLRDGRVTPESLMVMLAPGARLVFLLCYGFAALSKYNSDFLFSEQSVAREMLQIQIGAMPVLSWLVWSPSVPWIALVCETIVPTFVLWHRTRWIGILVGVFFHAALVISPAVKVYDFTITVYTMLYLFTSGNFDRNLQHWIDDFCRRAPRLNQLLIHFRRVLLFAFVATLVGMSVQEPLMDVSPQTVRLRWLVSTGVLAYLAALCCIGLFNRPVNSNPSSASVERRSPLAPWFPTWSLPYAVLALAVINGLCPYVGYKTQGSFTMFSNLATEAGRWNHLLMPNWLRVVNDYQDRLVAVVDTSDPVLNELYVQPELLATEFELRRRIMDQPTLSLTVVRNGKRIVLSPASEDDVLGAPLSFIARKLLVFRPVSPDGKPFVTN